MTELAEVQSEPSNSLIQVIERAAINPDVDIDKMERLLNMQERIVDKQAEQDWNTAMTKAQLAMPIIKPDGENTHTVSKYAKYETINKVIKPIYADNGFSLTFGQGKGDEVNIKVTCDVAHIGGYTKQYFIDLPPDTLGIGGKRNKTDIHGTASAFSYAQRYLVKLIFNLTISGEDDDGNAAGGDTRSALEVHEDHCAYMALVRDLWPTIAAIKEGIVTNDYEKAIEARSELTDDEKKGLWKAPTKGGIFTTNERAVMKSDEWGAKLREMIGESK